MEMSKDEDASLQLQSQEENELDPRIQMELERLNNFTNEINRLEMELDDANSALRVFDNEYRSKLTVLYNRYGRYVERARPYYETVELFKKVQQECQEATVKFQRASEIHQAAKETVSLAEARFLSNKHEWKFDETWQDMISHAVTKVTNAEYEKASSEREHRRCTKVFHEIDAKVRELKQKCQRYVPKARPYFEHKMYHDKKLAAMNANINKLKTAITESKNEYALSLRKLENISEEIHVKRKQSVQESVAFYGPREPGVGAELSSTCAENYSKEEEMLDIPSTSGTPFRKRSMSLDCDEYCDMRSIGSGSVATSCAVSDIDDLEQDLKMMEDVEELRQKVMELSSKADEEEESRQ